MKRLSFVCCLAALMLCISGCGSSKKAITVMSYNIRLGTVPKIDGANSWDKRKEATPAMLADVAPTVFGVQEAYDFQIAYIMRQCPQYACVGVGRDDGVSKGEHMSVFYLKDRLRLLDWGTWWLSETPEQPSFGWDAACRRTATWCLFETVSGGKRFYFVNTHLDHKGKEARKNGLALIQEKIAAMNPEHLPLVLQGDFNITSGAPELSQLESSMHNARSNASKSTDKGSYNAWGKRPSKAIDHIYYDGFSRCVLFDVIDKSYAGKPYISDHYPVIAELRF